MPAPMTATPRERFATTTSELSECDCDVRTSGPGLDRLFDALAVDPGGVMRPFLPGEHADRHDRVVPAAEAELAERAEELVPVDLALADVQVLVDPGGGSGRV